MPPRLPMASALRVANPATTLLRAFSTTTSAASPPRNHSSSSPSSSSSQPSSTASLLSMNKERSPAKANAGGSSNSGGAATMTPGVAANRMLKRYRDQAERVLKNKQEQLDKMRSRKLSSDYLRQMPRRWEAGDVYSPHDLSPVEMQKWRTRSQRKADVVDVLGIRPLDMYKNFSLAQEFTSTSGQITHSSGTGLRPVNQRKIAKMIRRLQGMGIYPTIHDHPEMIRSDFFSERD